MKKALKGILLSVLSLAVGYIAISLPFHMLGTLESTVLHKVFIGELMIYLVISLLFLVFRQKRKEQQIKCEMRHEARREKIASVKRDWYDLAA